MQPKMLCWQDWNDLRLATRWSQARNRGLVFLVLLGLTLLYEPDAKAG
jgi:hypothetical protein